MISDPADLSAAADAFFCEAITSVRARLERPILVGLSGPQGSGKSTTAKRISERLGVKGFRIVACSLDDFYLTKVERAALADRVHPLLEVRGVPGTHDVALMGRTISALLASESDDEIAVPVFDKAAGDRLPKAGWHRVSGRVDVVLLEGWCVGARPQPEIALTDPINLLERDCDRAGVWRRFVNDQLAGSYSTLFEQFDLKIMLRAPSFAVVHGWRAEQEMGLDRTHGSARPPMSDDELAQFISHYERITEWILEDRPADVIVDLNEVRSPIALWWKLRLKDYGDPNA